MEKWLWDTPDWPVQIIQLISSLLGPCRKWNSSKQQFVCPWPWHFHWKQKTAWATENPAVTEVPAPCFKWQRSVVNLFVPKLMCLFDSWSLLYFCISAMINHKFFSSMRSKQSHTDKVSCKWMVKLSQTISTWPAGTFATNTEVNHWYFLEWSSKQKSPRHTHKGWCYTVSAHVRSREEECGWKVCKKWYNVPRCCKVSANVRSRKNVAESYVRKGTMHPGAVGERVFSSCVQCDGCID